jgi:hypothetical protein
MSIGASLDGEQSQGLRSRSQQAGGRDHEALNSMMPTSNACGHHRSFAL